MVKTRDREPQILHKLRQFHVDVETLARESEELHTDHSLLKTKMVRLAHDLMELVEQVRRDCGDCLRKMQQMNVRMKRRHGDEDEDGGEGGKGAD